MLLLLYMKTKTKVWSRASKYEGKYACGTTDCGYRSKKLWNLQAHCKRKSHYSSNTSLVINMKTEDLIGKKVGDTENTELLQVKSG